MCTNFHKKYIGVISLIISIISFILCFSCIGSSSIANLLSRAIRINISLLSLSGFFVSLSLSYLYKDSYLIKKSKIISIIGIFLFILLLLLRILFN